MAPFFFSADGVFGRNVRALEVVVQPNQQETKISVGEKNSGQSRLQGPCRSVVEAPNNMRVKYYCTNTQPQNSQRQVKMLSLLSTNNSKSSKITRPSYRTSHWLIVAWRARSLQRLLPKAVTCPCRHEQSLKSCVSEER